MKIPLALKNNPIQEALFEIRFKRTEAPPPEILPGIFFTEGKKDFELSKIERLISPIPEEILEKEERLRYMPQVRIKGEKFGIQIADEAISLSYFAPYGGWFLFKKKIDNFLNILESVTSNLFLELKRFSLKYVNLFEKYQEITPLSVSLKIDDISIEKKLLIIVEIEENNKKIILNLNSEAVLQKEDKLQNGLLLAIDVIEDIPEEKKSIEQAFAYIRENLEKLHDLEKFWFFKLLKEKTIENLGPIYES